MAKPIASAFLDGNLKLHLHEESQKFIGPNDSTRGPIKRHLNEE